jgi:hypothetical protein
MRDSAGRRHRYTESTMPLFERLTDLPPKTHAVESAVLDLKKETSPTNHFELAKDVAAFANHLGGCLLIGATEVDGHVGEYDGIPPEVADKLQTSYSLAVAQRCSPKPVIDFKRFSAERDGYVVLAVFVDPYVGGHPIGVETKGGEKPNAYAFPVRTGKDAMYLLPEQLAMFSEPKLRRTFIMMSAIPLGGRLKVASITNRGQPPEVFFGTLRDLSLERNVVHFDRFLDVDVVSHSGSQIVGDRVEPVLIALDQIRSVFRATTDEALVHQWNILTEPFA